MEEYPRKMASGVQMEVPDQLLGHGLKVAMRQRKQTNPAAKTSMPLAPSINAIIRSPAFGEALDMDLHPPVGSDAFKGQHYLAMT